MNNENVKTESTKATKSAVQKREISAFTGAESGKYFNKV